ncbi:hypothetical protein ACFLXY_07485 [Chloroflexota bacterium]
MRPEAEREAVNRLAVTEIGDNLEDGKPSSAESKEKDAKTPEGSEQFEAAKSHRETIQRLSQSLTNNLKLPSVMDKDLWRFLPLEFKPGTYYLPIGQLDVAEDGEIKVNLPEISAGIAEPHLVQALLNHLSTSGESRFSGLAVEIGKLETLRMKSSHYSELMVSLYKALLDSFTGTGAPIHDSDDIKPGLTKYFFITAWVDVVLKTEGHIFIYDGWYKPPEVIPGTGLWKIKCGAFDIAIAEDTQTLATYETQHQNLRKRYLNSTLVKEISHLGLELEVLSSEIRQALLEFDDKSELPGLCQLCSRSTE